MIIGHDRQIEYLERVAKNRRMAHAYLFYGPEYIGKHLVAHAFAKCMLLCKNSKDKNMKQVCIKDASDTYCASCLDIKHGTHPDMIELGLTRTLVSDKETRREIPIEDIRELKRRISLRPARGGFRIVLVDNADALSRPAANAFLKLLEEPSADTIIVLIAPNIGGILPTIASRTVPIRFTSPPEHALREFLAARVDADNQHDELLTLAHARPGRLVRLLDDASLHTEARELLDMFRSAAGRGLVGLLQFSEYVDRHAETRHDAAIYILRYVRGILRKIAANGKIDQSAVRSAQSVVRTLELMHTTNVNQRLALDIALIGLTSMRT